MADIYAANTILVIGNDPSQQNPLVAWQIRTAIRHHNASLYLINSQPSKLERKASITIRVAAGGEAAAVHWLARNEGNFPEEVSAQLAKLKENLEQGGDAVILFGAGISGAAISDLITFGSRLQGLTRLMALGDYANSRGAADMGVLSGPAAGLRAAFGWRRALAL